MKKLLLLFSLAFSFLTAAAQDDYELYMSQAGGSSLLYRGHQAHNYPMLFNGTFYWESPAFKDGDIFYNGKLYRNISVNIDAFRQDLVVKDPNAVSIKLMVKDYVDWFTMDGNKFLNLQNLYGEDSPSGYWMVIHDGDAKVLKQVKKLLERDLDGRNKGMIGYDDPHYRKDVFDVFTYKESFCYVSPEGKVVPLKSKARLLKQYDKATKAAVKRHISKLESKQTLDMEEFFIEAMKFIEAR